jgi:hypothetical protein
MEIAGVDILCAKELWPGSGVPQAFGQICLKIGNNLGLLGNDSSEDF